jgi:phospholipid/cholesterol/gamma-HCH transport system substrate-binding protein
MKRTTLSTSLRFGTFAVVMALLTACLFVVFGQVRTGATSRYTAVFADASRLRAGDSVRVAGIRVGTVDSVDLQPDMTVRVKFDADRTVVLTTGTRAAVRYLNLVGDRYLELVDSPGSTRIQPPGALIPVDHTAPALDLDLLLGGLKPVVEGLNPQDINALTGALIQIFQGQGGTIDSLLTKTSSFSNTVADNGSTVQALIDNLNTVMHTIANDGSKFSDIINRLQQLITGLSSQRQTIGSAIDALATGTASITDLLRAARPPLAGTVDQLSRLAPILDSDKDLIDVALRRAPGNYRKLARIGAYGSFVQFYVCAETVRVTDLQGRTAVFPWVRQTGGRCAEPK